MHGSVTLRGQTNLSSLQLKRPTNRVTFTFLYLLNLGSSFLHLFKPKHTLNTNDTSHLYTYATCSFFTPSLPDKAWRLCIQISQSCVTKHQLCEEITFILDETKLDGHNTPHLRMESRNVNIILPFAPIRFSVTLLSERLQKDRQMSSLS